MATIWLTYAWTDNESRDVDFVAQELISSGLGVKLDRWNLGAGKRLWEQLDAFITKPEHCSAWLLYATQASLGSEACREEFAYALDRALKTRGEGFPVIGLFPGTVDSTLIPAALKTRLYVSISDPDWKERIKAAAEGRSASISRVHVEPYEIRLLPRSTPTEKYVLEVRPRAGSWSPFCACIPIQEKDRVKPHILHGPRGRAPQGGVLWSSGESASTDGSWWVVAAGNEATPTQSYFIFCQELPSKLVFGVNAGGPQYLIEPPALLR